MELALGKERAKLETPQAALKGNWGQWAGKRGCPVAPKPSSGKKVLKDVRGKDPSEFFQAEHSPPAGGWSVKEGHWGPSPMSQAQGGS